jgi:hypothetical protein
VPIPAGDEIFVPPEAEHYGDPPVDVSPLYLPTAEYEVQSVNQTTRYARDGRAIQTIEVDFQILGLAGLYSILIDNYAFDHADPLEYIRHRVYTVRELWALPERLPPYVAVYGIVTAPVVTLDSVVPVPDPAGGGSAQWAGTVNPQGYAATADFEITHVGDAEPTLVSATIDIPASTTAVRINGTTGPVDPGLYSCVITADNRHGLSTSAERALRIV